MFSYRASETGGHRSCTGSSLSEVWHVLVQQAKKLHPDVLRSNNANHAAFLQLLTAYEVMAELLPCLFVPGRHSVCAVCALKHTFFRQVLSNDRERQLYDLSIDANAGRMAREAASERQAPRHALSYIATAERCSLRHEESMALHVMASLLCCMYVDTCLCCGTAQRL
jgi:hypothetical protein